MSDRYGRPAAESVRLCTPGEGKDGDTAAVRDAAASRDFSFPYPTAYPMQLDLMRAVFRTIEEGQVGIFESPTGTGKSLSLICAACTWLQKHAARSKAVDGVSGAESGDEPDWVRQHTLQRQQAALQDEEAELKKRIARARLRQAQQRRLAASEQRTTAKKRSRGDGEGGAGDRETAAESDDEFLVDAYDTGAVGSSAAGGTANDAASFLSPAVLALMEKTGSTLSKSKERGAKPFYARQRNGAEADDEDEEPETTPKLIYVSRTHSQLSQFIGELKRTAFGRETTETTADNDASPFFVRTVALGSRKQMCINPSVRATGERAGTEAVNDRCVELMKAKDANRCQYLPSADAAGQVKMLDFRDNAFTAVRDIEDIVALGRQMHTCPYFGARGGGKQAHLIAMPYSLLLSATARASLNIDLKGSVVIVDEAHNLIDTILASHTVIVSDAHLRGAVQQVQTYLARFSTRLKGANEVNLKKLLSILDGLLHVCMKHAAKRGGETLTVSAAELVRLIGNNADQVNLNELERWLRETRIARKIAGYADKQQQREDKDGAQKGSTRSAHSVALSALRSIEALLLSLANRNLDGRIFISSAAGDAAGDGGEQQSKRGSSASGRTAGVVTLKYQLLNPADVFSAIVHDARSVILAGGTMEPMSDFQTQLFPTLTAERLTRFSCKHVVPPQNILSAIIGKGAKGTPMEFTFDARTRPALLDELTATLTNYCSVIPHGVVVFVPSYAFLDTLRARWSAEQRDGSGSGLARLAAKKRIFYEPRLASDVETVLHDYSQAIEQVDGPSRTGGALLFAVVGAKLSEGINFSDRLARAVIMVGMPFANARNPELVERMEYVRRLAAGGSKAATTATTATRGDAGQELYVNLCMKAVNQSIGRAIRHRNDYAALIFLDARYARADIRGRLPHWIRESTNVYDSFGASMAALGSFFREKRTKIV